jgi:hypothetical protein
MDDVSTYDEGGRPSNQGRQAGGTSTTRGFSLPLWAVLAGGLMLSVVLGFALRALGRGVLAVPDNLPSLAISALLPATIFPVLGNCFGYWMSFRVKPSRHSTRLFVAIGAVMSVLGVALTAAKLPASASAGSVATTIAVSLTPSILVVAALLLFASQPSARR